MVKLYKLYSNYKTIEDSIFKKVNPTNTLIYRICDEYRAFYFIKDSLQWTCYFIKNLEVDPMLPTGFFGENYRPFLTELHVFNADSLFQALVKTDIYKVRQISEDSIQIKLGYITKKQNYTSVKSLPQSSHDCDAIIIIYGNLYERVTYRGALVNSEELHKIPTLKIFYEAKEILIKSINDYYE